MVWSACWGRRTGRESGGGLLSRRVLRAAEAELAEAQPLPGNAFKVPLARNTLVRTLLDLTGEGV